MKKFISPFLIAFLVLFLDQFLKIWIKLHMYLGQEIFVMGDWFRLHFTENEGMAFGLTLGGEYGKIILSLFRIAAVLVIGVYLIHIIRKAYPNGLIISMALILSGALGNIIDSVFYGVVFSASSSHIAHAFPEAGGYAPYFYGKVVDMLYFPVYQGFFPDWVPIWGGTYQIFFRPVFNIADAAITIGVFMILLFQKRYFKEDIEEENTEEENSSPSEEEESAQDATVPNPD